MPSKLQKFQDIAKILQTDTVSPTDLSQVLKAVIKVVTETKLQLSNLVIDHKQEVLDKCDKTISECKKIQDEMVASRETVGVKGQIKELGKRIRSEIDQLRESIPGSFQKELSVIKDNIPTIDQIENDLPKLGAQIRDGLELLTGDERLDKSAVKGIEEIEKEIKRIETTSSGSRYYVGPGGGSSSGGGHTIQDEGVSLAQRTELNFVGDGVTAADSGGKTVVTIPGATATTPDGPDFALQFNGGGAFSGLANFQVDIGTMRLGVSQDGSAPDAQGYFMDVGGATSLTSRVNYESSPGVAHGFHTDGRITSSTYIDADTFVGGGGTTGIKIDGSGNVAIGSGFFDGLLQVASDDTSLGFASLTTAENVVGSFNLNFQKARSGLTVPSMIDSGDELGVINFRGFAEVTGYKTGAAIKAISSGTIGEDRLPGQLEFYTATNAAPSVLTRRMYIDNAGTVHVVGAFAALEYYGPGGTTKPIFNGPGGSATSGDSMTFRTTTAFTNTSGTRGFMVLTPSYNQTSGTAANTDLLVNRTQTAVGSGTQRLLDLQVGGVSRFNVTNTGITTVGSTLILGGGINFSLGAFVGSITNAASASSAVGSVSMGYTFARTNTSGQTDVVTISPSYNQASGTASNTDLLINRTETAVGSGVQRLLDLQVGSTSQFNVSNIGTVHAPGLVRVGNASPNETTAPFSVEVSTGTEVRCGMFNTTVNTMRTEFTVANSAASSTWTTNFISMMVHGGSYASNNYLGTAVSDAGLGMILGQGTSLTNFAVGTYNNTPVYFFNNNTIRMAIAAGGNVGIGGSSTTVPTTTSLFNVGTSAEFQVTSTGSVGIGQTPTAYLHIKAGTATANTAPIKFTTGTNTTAAVAGQMEYDNTFHLTNSDATRRHVATAPNTTKVTAGAPYTNDGYVVVNIGGTDFKVMTTA